MREPTYITNPRTGIRRYFATSSAIASRGVALGRGDECSGQATARPEKPTHESEGKQRHNEYAATHTGPDSVPR